ncbi:hypothetical protein F5X97DRAFT_341620 [Nemania serpens]|nr:hypothetical protein F5X97DRAFT_341620 [Nemania serpens]
MRTASAAPYPEGDILYHAKDRYVGRHDDKVTKYTTIPDGMGATEHPNEALALFFVEAEVISSHWDRITMDYIEGEMPQQAWPVLPPSERLYILAQLRGCIAQMRALGRMHLSRRLDSQGAVVPNIMMLSGKPSANSY